jgi:CIC family chloride channel protein
VVLGIFCGLYALYFANTFHWSEHGIKAKYKSIWKRVLFAGVILAALTFLMPPLFGEGYETIKDLANGRSEMIAEKLQFINLAGHDWWVLIFLGLVVFLKPIASGATIGGGGNGGTFAPSLFSGSIIGFLFASLFNKIGLHQVPVGNFCLVAMAGLLSGVMYCPLSAIFLIAEITNGYTLFIPLMIVSSLSFFIARRKNLISKEAAGLDEEGNLYSQRKENNIWNTMALEELIKTDYPVLSVQQNLGDLIGAITKSDKQVVAIQNKHGRFIGIIDLNKIKDLLFHSEHKSQVPLKTLYKPVNEVFYLDTPVMDFINHIDHSNNWYLPVLNSNKQFVGFISRTILFEKFRETMNVDDSGF